MESFSVSNLELFLLNTKDIRDINSQKVQRRLFSASFVKGNYSPTCILSKRDRVSGRTKNEKVILECRKKETENLHKLITFTVVTCEAQWRKVIFTTINLTTFSEGRRQPETWEMLKSFELENIAFRLFSFLLIPKKNYKKIRPNEILSFLLMRLRIA